MHTLVADDAYDKDMAGGAKSSYAGPNAAFFANYLDGEAYERHVRHYTFVQQLETDCCAMAHGWLDALLAPMLDRRQVLVAGARLNVSCLHEDDAKRDTCTPWDAIPQ